MLEEHRHVVEALRDALLVRSELIGDEILEVIGRAQAEPDILPANLRDAPRWGTAGRRRIPPPDDGLWVRPGRTGVAPDRCRHEPGADMNPVPGAGPAPPARGSPRSSRPRRGDAQPDGPGPFPGPRN